MKKNLLAMGMLAAMLSGLAGCGNNAVNTTNATQEQVQSEETTVAEEGGSEEGYKMTEPVELTFASQDVGSSGYVYGSAMVNLFVDAFPEGSIVDQTTTSPGALGSPVLIESDQCDVTISNGTPALWATTTGVLDNPPCENVMGIAGGLDKVYINVLFTQEFVDKTGITTLEEVVEQKYPVRIAVKSAGSFGEMTCEKVFEVLGVTYEDIESWGGSVTQTGADAIVSLLKDGKADLTIDHIPAGQSATSELCMTTDIYFPQLSDETLEKLYQEGYDYQTLPAGSWSGQEKDIKTVGSPQNVICSAELDDATVYAMTKALCENKDALVNASAAMEAFEPETAWKPEKLGAPLHPGAEAYYKEMGYMK